jgi:hypothetical protein
LSAQGKSRSFLKVVMLFLKEEAFERAITVPSTEDVLEVLDSSDKQAEEKNKTQTVPIIFPQRETFIKPSPSTKSFVASECHPETLETYQCTKISEVVLIYIAELCQ